MRGVAEFNAGLIGVPGGRSRIETPALILDLDAIEKNLSRMSAITGASRLGLRPHAKTHKCAAIARRQLDAGALGICCAKPGELLALFASGIKPLLLTAPVSDPRKITRLANAAAAGCDLMVVADRLDLIVAFNAAAANADTRIGIVIDVDPGLGRTGVTTQAEAVSLAAAIAAAPNLDYRGVQAYSGQVQHIFGSAERRVANIAANARIRAIVEALTAAGYPPAIVSGGGTGSSTIDGENSVLSEVQAGSYVFMDEGYRPVEGAVDEFAFALFVAVSVIGHSASGDAITDAGSKSFAIDGPPPRCFRDGQTAGIIAWAGDEFGRLKPEANVPVPPVGTILECTVPHCDPTANLHDYLHVMRADTLVEIWPIEGRGRSD
ncbi:MAG: hypothetical protein JWR75_1331 [Devosia sp.]|nr:hypothetical protein [Devosia sp.]